MSKPVTVSTGSPVQTCATACANATAYACANACASAVASVAADAIAGALADANANANAHANAHAHAAMTSIGAEYYDDTEPDWFDARDAAEAAEFAAGHHPWPKGDWCPDCSYRVDAPGHRVECIAGQGAHP